MFKLLFILVAVSSYAAFASPMKQGIETTGKDALGGVRIPEMNVLSRNKVLSGGSSSSLTTGERALNSEIFGRSVDVSQVGGKRESMNGPVQVAHGSKSPVLIAKISEMTKELPDW